MVFMESDTELVQYIISKWSLQLRYKKKTWFSHFLTSQKGIQVTGVWELI